MRKLQLAWILNFLLLVGHNYEASFIIGIKFNRTEILEHLELEQRLGLSLLALGSVLILVKVFLLIPNV